MSVSYNPNSLRGRAQCHVLCRESKRTTFLTRTKTHIVMQVYFWPSFLSDRSQSPLISHAIYCSTHQIIPESFRAVCESRWHSLRLQGLWVNREQSLAQRCQLIIVRAVMCGSVTGWLLLYPFMQFQFQVHSSKLGLSLWLFSFTLFWHVKLDKWNFNPSFFKSSIYLFHILMLFDKCLFFFLVKSESFLPSQEIKTKLFFQVIMSSSHCKLSTYHKL